MPVFFETPPVKVTSRSMPTRRISPIARETVDRCTPARMSSIFFPRASHDSTSDSANTVQVVLMATGFSPRSDVGPSSSSGISSAAAAAPRKRPVPAAHLSFMQKSTIVAGRIDANRLGVLPAHVDDRARVREGVDGAAPVAADLGDLDVAEGDAVAPVAGAGHERDLHVSAGPASAFAASNARSAATTTFAPVSIRARPATRPCSSTITALVWVEPTSTPAP